MDRRPHAVLAFGEPTLAEQLFPAHLWGRLASAVRLESGVVLTETTSAAAHAHLAEAEVLIAGWDAPRVSSSAVPHLRGVFYAGGVARTCLQDPERLAARGVVAANARAANAVPVAEYTLAMILLANKGTRAAIGDFSMLRHKPVPRPGVGNYRRVIGIVGASQVGRLVIELLRPFDLDVLVHDPMLTEDEAAELGVRTGTLEEVAAGSQVLSLHQPLTDATTGQIDGRILALLPDGATVINTARGAVVDEAALLAELRRGRLEAVLDVTDPEPPTSSSELWRLPNVVLTPHIAGSMGTELHRIGLQVVQDVERFVRGEPVHHPEELG